MSYLHFSSSTEYVELGTILGTGGNGNKQDEMLPS